MQPPTRFTSSPGSPLNPREREAAPGVLTHLHPHLFDIAQHEAVAQQPLDSAIALNSFRLDMLRHETLVMGRPGAEIIEFKRGGHRQLHGLGLSQFEYLGAEQVANYAPASCVNTTSSNVDRPQGTASPMHESRVVGGFVGDADRNRLARARGRFAEIEIEGWDVRLLLCTLPFSALPDEWVPDTPIAL